MLSVPPDKPSDHARQINDALDAYIRAPSAESEAALLALAPGEHGLRLLDIGDSLRVFPDSGYAVAALRDELTRAAADSIDLDDGVVQRPHGRTRRRFRTWRRASAQVQRPQLDSVLDAYVRTPSAETQEALLRAVPGEQGMLLLDVCDSLRAFPGSGYHDQALWTALIRASAPSLEASRKGTHRRHPAPGRSRRGTRVQAIRVLTATVVVAAVAAAAGSPSMDFRTRPSGSPLPGAWPDLLTSPHGKHQVRERRWARPVPSPVPAIRPVMPTNPGVVPATRSWRPPRTAARRGKRRFSRPDGRSHRHFPVRPPNAAWWEVTRRRRTARRPPRSWSPQMVGPSGLPTHFRVP